MLNESKDSKPFRNSIKDKQDKIIDDVMEQQKQEESENQVDENVFSRIEKTAKNGTEFIKSGSHWESIKTGTSKLKEKSLEQEIKLKKHSPKIYRRITSGFFYFFETLVGRIKIGLQYGSPSLEILERLAKLKELGILTDEEFAKKKKKILDRI